MMWSHRNCGRPWGNAKGAYGGLDVACTTYSLEQTSLSSAQYLTGMRIRRLRWWRANAINVWAEGGAVTLGPRRIVLGGLAKTCLGPERPLAIRKRFVFLS